MKRMKKGFTLAEILITLVIIGVIGALTVPALIQNTQKQEYVSALKKAYSTLSQAAQMIITEEGSPQCSTGGWACSSESIYNMFRKYLNNVKECGSSGGCFEQLQNSGYKWLKGGGSTNTWNLSVNDYRTLITADGSQILFTHKSDDCSLIDTGSNGMCARITVDINGAKGPNIIGRDVFYFVLKENGVFPQGCDYGDYCTGADAYGHSCACKVITEGAMNY